MSGALVRLLRAKTMLKWAIIFLVLSLIAGALGMTPVARGARTISMVLFTIAVIMFVIFVIFILLGIMAVDAVT